MRNIGYNLLGTVLIYFYNKGLFLKLVSVIHCAKSVRIRSFSGPYFPAFGLNTERYGVSVRIQSECGKIRTRKTPNTDTFYAVILFSNTMMRLSRGGRKLFWFNKRRTRWRPLKLFWSLLLTYQNQVIWHLCLL